MALIQANRLTRRAGPSLQRKKRWILSAISALSKLAVGVALFQQLDIEDFVNGQRTVVNADTLTRLSEKLATHSYLVKRLQALSDFFRSDIYRTLTVAD